MFLPSIHPDHPGYVRTYPGWLGHTMDGHHRPWMVKTKHGREWSDPCAIGGQTMNNHDIIFA